MFRASREGAQEKCYFVVSGAQSWRKCMLTCRQDRDIMVYAVRQLTKVG